MSKYIVYTGEDLVINKDHRLWGGMTALYKNKVYKLHFDFDWNKELVGPLSINDFVLLYIYDELTPSESRGYEISLNDVKSIREYNLEKLIKE